MTKLQTERLLLREMTEADAAHIFRMNSNPNVVQYVHEPTLESEAAAIEVLHTHIFPQYDKYKVGRWAVVLKDTSEFVGWCGLKFMPDEGVYDLGYRFIEEYWGKGYATEAARAVLDYGRKHLAGERIIAKALLANADSIRVLEKIGMRFESHEHACGGEAAVYSVEHTTQE